MNILEQHKEYLKIINGDETLKIDDILELARELTRNSINKTPRKISLSRKTERNIQEVVKNLTETYDKLPYIKNLFIYDKKFSNGFVKKCVVNSFKNLKYKKYLNSIVADLNKNKEKLYKDFLYTFDYIMWHDLSANRIEVIKTIDTFSEVLEVIINSLMKNNITDINELILVGTVFERRLYQLYCLYGHYLNDIGNSREYLHNIKYFEKLDNSFECLVSYLKDRSCK